MPTFRKTVETFEHGSLTLRGDYYTSREIFNDELENIFYNRWICVGREEQVKNAGDYVVIKVGKESVIVLRDSDGGIQAFFNICRHRGTLICREAAGNCSAYLQCPYHGWKYNLKGELVSAPLMDEVGGFRKEDFPLHSVSVQSWEGFLLLNLSQQPEPFAATYAPIIGKFSRWQLSQLCVARSIDYEVSANWKIIIENYLECYHCPIIHHEFVRKVPYRSGENDLHEGPFLGGFMQLKPEVNSLTRSGLRCGPPLGKISGKDLKRVYFYSIFPNITLSLHPDFVMSFVLLPLDFNRTRVICEWLFTPEAIVNGECNPDDAVQFWDNANREDWEVCSLVQEGVKSHRYGPSPYSNTESLPVAFINEVLKALNPKQVL